MCAQARVSSDMLENKETVRAEQQRKLGKIQDCPPRSDWGAQGYYGKAAFGSIWVVLWSMVKGKIRRERERATS